MKYSIIVHSVCGNTYLMAKSIKETLELENQDVKLFRVEDDQLDKTAETISAARPYREEIKALEVATPDSIAQADVVFMGSPTYFGNVSAQMKVFMDSTAGLWIKSVFAGKKLVSFASSAHSEGGAELALQAINIYGQHMGMQLISIPTLIVKGVKSTAYGIVHYAGPLSDNRVTKENFDPTALVKYLIENL